MAADTEKNKAVIFDLDGTLIDSLPLFQKAYSRAIARSGLPSIPQEEIPFRCFGKPETEIAKALGRPDLGKQFQESYFFEVKSTIVPLSKPVSGAIDLLERLSKAGVGLGIVSFAYRWYVDSIVSRLGISEKFQSIVGREDVKNPKPSPEGALLACETLGVLPKNALVVGDAASDILMGSSAGCRTALFHPESYSRFFKKGDLLATRPDCVIEDISQVLDVVFPD